MRTRVVISLMALALGLLGAASLLASAQGTPAPLGIVPTPTPTTLTVNVSTDKPTYVVGETLRVYFAVSQPAYVYLYDVQPDGVVRLVFPNAYSQNNFVTAGSHTLPDGAYQFSVTPPTGVEQLQIIASLTPLALAPTAYGEAFPQVAPNPNSAMGEIQGHIMGITPTPVWVTAWASFTITSPTYGYTPSPYPPYPPYSPAPPAYPPFFGWFGGGTWYWEGGEWHYGVPASGWYWYFGPDGHWHFSLRIHIGN
jgi:hypothetical protein